MILSSEQQKLIELPFSGRLFLQGQAGTGKTTTATARYLRMIDAQIPAETILILTPQRTLATLYMQAATRPDLPAGGNTTIATLGGLARRMIDLFWPMIAKSAGMAKPEMPPLFLTMETAQYYMAHLVRPLIDEGYFETIKIDHNRLYSQLIDNLNKAAGAGFSYAEIGERLKSAWVGEPAQQHVYDEAQDCVNRFRQFCLRHNLLDFSLQIEIFTNLLWPSVLCRNYLIRQYRHLLYDNIEEDIPVAQDILRDWLPEFESAWVIHDNNGGYRTFLGADPENGQTLQQECNLHASFTHSWIVTPGIKAFEYSLANSLARKPELPDPQLSEAIKIASHNFYPEMIDWVCRETAQLIESKEALPGEVVIIAPFISDSLRFSLMGRLEQLSIPARSHRPSRSLREEPATNCLLALAKLTHPHWELPCTQPEIRQAIMQAIEGMDLVRADLLSRICFRENRWQEGFSSFDSIQPEMQERITFLVGEKFEKLRRWIQDYREMEEHLELDVFIGRIFGELLSQPGFGFHSDLDAAEVASRLVESVQKFRWSIEPALEQQHIPIGKEYIQMVTEGVVAAQYLQSWENLEAGAVLVAPAYTFLMSNRSARYQFWLDIGSPGWWERLYQPLTHPYVLSRHWNPDASWTEVDEQATSQKALSKLTSGLLLHCSQRVYLCSARVNQQGEEGRGQLQQAVQRILRRLPEPPEVLYV